MVAPCLSCSWQGILCAREGDHARSHPALDFRRWWNGCRRAVPGRECAELRLVLVRDPTWLVAALLGDEREHRVPARSGFGVIVGAARATVGDQTKLAVSHEHVARWPLRQESTVWARFPADTQRSALRAFDQLAGLVRQP